MELRDVLQGMDPADENQWTATELPKLDYLSEVMGAKVTRKDVDACGKFVRPKAPEPIEPPSENPDRGRAELVVDNSPATAPDGIGKPVSLTDARDRHNTVKRTFGAAKDALVRASNDLDDWITHDAKANPQDFRTRNQAFLKRSLEIRRERAAKLAKVQAALGIDAKGSLAAPIDQALARRRQNDRPTLPVDYGRG